MFEHLPKDDVVFSTDIYQGGSIKAMERKRRGTGEKIILSGEAIKRPGDWLGFLANDEKKSQLVGMLLDVWSSDRMAAKLKDRNVILVFEGIAYKLSSPDWVRAEKKELSNSSQEETDSKVILYCLFGKQQ